MYHKRILDPASNLKGTALNDHLYALDASKRTTGSFSSSFPIGRMILGWSEYAENHQSIYNSLIGEDGVLGIYWEDIGKGLLGLLNGDIGGFDAGSLDHNIRAFAAQHGVTLE